MMQTNWPLFSNFLHLHMYYTLHQCMAHMVQVVFVFQSVEQENGTKVSARTHTKSSIKSSLKLKHFCKTRRKWWRKIEKKNEKKTEQKNNQQMCADPWEIDMIQLAYRDFKTNSRDKFCSLRLFFFTINLHTNILKQKYNKMLPTDYRFSIVQLIGMNQLNISMNNNETYIKKNYVYANCMYIPLRFAYRCFSNENTEGENLRVRERLW